MTQNDFFKSIEDSQKAGLDLVKKKNLDYATGEDPFKNFTFSEIVGVSPERAILVRISDKLARVSNLLDKTNSVLDEKLEDTLLDISNYVLILKAKLEDKQHGRNKVHKRIVGNLQQTKRSSKNV
jgi:hypothetical protein